MCADCKQPGLAPSLRLGHGHYAENRIPLCLCKPQTQEPLLGSYYQHPNQFSVPFFHWSEKKTREHPFLKCYSLKELLPWESVTPSCPPLVGVQGRQ